MLTDLLDQLDAQLLELQALVLGAQLVEARTFALPVYDKEQSSVPDEIHIESIFGDEGREFGWRRIKSYTGDPNTNLKMTRKAAGFIWLDCHPETLAELCNQVNDTKLAIKAFLAAQRNRHVRFDMVHELRPYAITMQILRQVRYCNDPLTSIRFSWATKTSNVRANTDMAINLIEQKHRNDESIEDEARVKVLAHTIAQDRNREVAFRRRLAPTPVIHLRYVEKPAHLSSKTQQFGNPTPILIAGTRSSLKSVGDLADYTTNGERSARFVSENVIIRKTDPLDAVIGEK